MDQLLAIRTFVRVAEAASFARAADSLNLPRSTVSKLVQDLEAHLGTQLVERTTRSVTITAEGLAYRERALRLLADLEDMDGQAAGSRAVPKGRLRVDIGSVMANKILIPRLPEFQNLYPDIDLMFGVNDRSADLIGEGIDCVIRGGPLGDSTLKARKLCEFDFVVSAAPAYLADRPLPQHPNDLTQHRITSYFSASSGKRFALLFQKGEERHEYTPLTPGISVNESTAHLNCIISGLGIGQTFGFLVRPYLKDGSLVELLPEWKPAHRLLHLVYPAERFPNTRLRAFAEWATEVFRPFDMRQQMRGIIHPNE